MPLIKPVLILLAFILLFVYFIRIRSRFLDRVTGLLLFLLAGLFIAFPDMSTRIAALFGVGRGVDLVFYFLFVFAGFVLVMLYSGMQENQRQITCLARAVALSGARASTQPVRRERSPENLS